jgi:hypothetical protein
MFVKPGTVVVVTPAVPDEAMNQVPQKVKPKAPKKSPKQTKHKSLKS